MRYLVLVFSFCCIFSNAFAQQYYKKGTYQGSKYRYEQDYDRYPSGGSTMRYPEKDHSNVLNPNDGFVNNGFYMGIRGGASLYDVKGKNSKEKDDSTWKQMFSIAMGGRYDHFRIEGEYVNRGPVSFQGDGYKNSFRNDSFMGNAYVDFLPSFVVTPYLSAGVGLTRIRYNSKGIENFKETKNVLTGSVGGGISARLSDSANMDFGYRYYISNKYNNRDLYYHDVYLGFRHVF